MIRVRVTRDAALAGHGGLALAAAVARWIESATRAEAAPASARMALRDGAFMDCPDSSAGTSGKPCGMGTVHGTQLL